MEFNFKTKITIVASIIWVLLHLFYNSFKYLAISDIILIYVIAFVFPFFAFKTNTLQEIPVLIFFLFNVSAMGKAIIKLDFLFNRNTIILVWIIKSLVVLIYVLILAFINKKTPPPTLE